VQNKIESGFQIGASFVAQEPVKSRFRHPRVLNVPDRQERKYDGSSLLTDFGNGEWPVMDAAGGIFLDSQFALA
jgi:hypothetical protein